MKKLLLTFLMVFAVMGMNAQTLSWSNLAPEIANEVKPMLPEISQAMTQQGIGNNITADYNAKTNSLDICFYFEQDGLVNLLPPEFFTQVKNMFVQSLVSNEDDPTGEATDLIIDSMSKSNGKITVVFQDAGGAKKEIVTTAADLKKAR